MGIQGLSSEVVQTALRSMLAPDRPPTQRTDLSRHNNNGTYYHKPSSINWPRDLSQPYQTTSSVPSYPRSNGSSQAGSRPWSRSQSPYLRYRQDSVHAEPPMHMPHFHGWKEHQPIAVAPINTSTTTTPPPPTTPMDDLSMTYEILRRTQQAVRHS